MEAQLGGAPVPPRCRVWPPAPGGLGAGVSLYPLPI